MIFFSVSLRGLSFKRFHRLNLNLFIHLFTQTEFYSRANSKQKMYRDVHTETNNQIWV